MDEKKGSRNLSNSSVQLEIEQRMLEIFGKGHPDWLAISWGKVVSNLNLPLPWQKAKPDGIWQTDKGIIIIAECYARMDVLKPGHRRKLAMDAFKLISIQRAVSDPQNLKCYLIIPEEIEQQLHGSDWFSWALSQAADIFPVKLTDDQRQRLMEATSLQALGQTRIKKIKGEILHG